MAFLTMLTAFVVAIMYVMADVIVPGIQTGTYQIGGDDPGCFRSDANSLIKSGGNVIVGWKSTVFAYGTSMTVENGSKLLFASGGTSSLWSDGYCTGLYRDSLVSLSHNSSQTHYEFTQYEQFRSSLRIGDSKVWIYKWSNVQLVGSNIQLDKSKLIIGESNRFKAADIHITMTRSTAQLSVSTKLDMKNATLTLTDSSITTGEGSTIFLSIGSTLLANKLTINTGEHSALVIGPSANLISMGSPASSITLGKRAELRVNANCIVMSNIRIPDLTAMTATVNVSGGGGFNCFPSPSAMKLFLDKSRTD